MPVVMPPQSHQILKFILYQSVEKYIYNTEMYAPAILFLARLTTINKAVKRVTVQN